MRVLCLLYTCLHYGPNVCCVRSLLASQMVLWPRARRNLGDGAESEAMDAQSKAIKERCKTCILRRILGLMGPRGASWSPSSPQA